MNWKDFLSLLATVKAIDVIGPFASSWSPSDRPALFVDSGARWRKPGPPSATVGDGDSTSVPMDMKLESEKDFSDFAFALRSLPQNLTDLYIYGFLGGRHDHELANFGELHAFLSGRERPTRVFLDSAVIGWSAGDWKFEWQGIFSLMVLEPAEVSVTGACKYPLVKPTRLAPLSSYGLSNEANGSVNVVTNKPLFCLLEK